jgi:hypothetical protein
MIEMKTQRHVQRKRISQRKPIKKGKQVQRKRLTQRGGGFFDDVWSGFKGVFVSQPAAPVENQSTQMPTNTSIPRRNESVVQPPEESPTESPVLAQPSMRRRRNNRANL